MNQKNLCWNLKISFFRSLTLPLFALGKNFCFSFKTNFLQISISASNKARKYFSFHFHLTWCKWACLIRKFLIFIYEILSSASLSINTTTTTQTRKKNFSSAISNLSPALVSIHAKVRWKSRLGKCAFINVAFSWWYIYLWTSGEKSLSLPHHATGKENF